MIGGVLCRAAALRRETEREEIWRFHDLCCRPDYTLQDLVYKLVPGLFTSE